MSKVRRIISLIKFRFLVIKSWDLMAHDRAAEADACFNQAEKHWEPTQPMPLKACIMKFYIKVRAEKYVDVEPLIYDIWGRISDSKILNVDEKNYLITYIKRISDIVLDYLEMANLLKKNYDFIRKARDPAFDLEKVSREIKENFRFKMS